MYNYGKKEHLKISKSYLVGYLFLVSVITVIFALLSYTQDIRKCTLHPVVELLLNELSIQNCSIIQKEDYSDIFYKISTPKVSDEEIMFQIDKIKAEYSLNELSDDFIKHFKL